MSSYWETAVNTIDGPVAKSSGPLQRWDSNDAPEHTAEPVDVFSSAILPCGRVLENRLVKVAMYEHLAHLGGSSPNEYHLKLYSKWSAHNWGMIVTGNVQVSSTHLSLGRDLVVPSTLSEPTVEPYKRLATVIHGESFGTLAIMQLCHAGRQSTNVIGGRMPFAPPLAPSAVAMGRGDGFLSTAIHSLMFQCPLEMTLNDIDQTVEEFARGARLALLAEYDGIQLHAAHGYLLAQFINPKTNLRTDEYSATHDTALRLLHRIAIAIRKVVPEDFIVGVKFNAADYVDGPAASGNASPSELRAIEHVQQIASWGSIDFIEISGGDYENPEFMTSKPMSSTSPRQAFFSRFSQEAMKALAPSVAPPPSSHAPPPPTPPLILLTGGLRTPAHLAAALRSNHADLLGIGRGSVLCPELPDLLRSRKSSYADDDNPFATEPDLDASHSFLGRAPWSWLWQFVPRITLVGAGMGMAWYLIAIRRLATLDEEPNVKMGGLEAVVRMWLWKGPSSCFLGSGQTWASLLTLAAVASAFLAYRL